MKFGKSIGTFAVAALVAGCHHTSGPGTYVVDISHLKTDEGYINSSRYVEGQIIVWNKETGFSEVLSGLQLPVTVDGFSRTSVVANNLSGVSLSADINKPVPVGLKTELEGDLAIKLENNVRGRSINEAFTKFGREINRRISAGDEDIRQTWFLDEAAEPGSPWRYIIVRKTLRADKGSIVGNRNAVANGKVTLSSFDLAGAGVTLKGYDKVEFEGENVPALANYYVLKVFRNASGNYDFRLDREITNKASVIVPILRRL
ncbi:MAG: hypothetical protein C0606_06980 [Hyphomicrobiales bacterium]|nr:MAG: hypothetical protein C0606_06980 [Hyphomicrobiales bacterium]